MRAFFPAMACLTLLGGCATTSGLQDEARRDPYESFNRKVYAFNKGVDKTVVKPVTKGYRAITPKPARRGLTAFLQNAREPLNFINALLQGKPKQAVETLGRFSVNTVLGVGGLADHATDMGLPAQKEDFGQTMAVWGIRSGPYIMLPLLGPSTMRDGFGFGVDIFTDPYRYGLREIGVTGWKNWAELGVEAIDFRSNLMDTADVLLRGSADEYATVRSAYLQSREALITDGASDTDEDVPNPEFAPADIEDMPDAPDTPDSPASDTPAPSPPAAEPIAEPAAAPAAPTP